MHKSIRILTFAAFLLLSGLSLSCGSSESESPDVTQQPAGAPTAPDAGSSNTGDTSPASTKNVLIIGDSITAGYGLQTEQAFPAILQDKVDELDWPFTIVDGGLSGDTSAGGLRRITWLLRQPVDILILELGGNDGLRGTSPEATEQNLQGIIDKVKEQNPEAKIILAGMQIPPNLGQEYTAKFREIFPTLAERNDALLIPFILEGVGGVSSLMQADGIHPTAEGHVKVADNVWEVLKPVLEAMREDS